MKNKPTSLYIHIPFCHYICSYCDFPKLQYFRLFAEKYIDQLENELKQVVDNKHLRTIYVGGGTPTVLEDDLFLKLLEIIKPYSSYVEEYTFEANPDSLTSNKLEMMKKYGVNRLSIGVESTNDKILKAINRHHTFLDVQKCVLEARKIGINNINLDLILGLPNVTKKMVEEDITNILSLKPNHVSCYSLTVHEHTMFHINKVEEPKDDFSYELYELIHRILLVNGYQHYEISNFSLCGYESKHNYVYWNNERYYGIGLGAAGYIDNIRYKNTSNLTKYLEGEYLEEKEIVDLRDAFEYDIMLNLRTIKGLDLAKIKEKYGVDLFKNKPQEVEKHLKNGNLILKNSTLVPTFKGMMILDQIILDLL